MTQSPTIGRPTYFTEQERKELGLPDDQDIAIMLDRCKAKDLSPFAAATNSLGYDVTGEPYCYCGFCKPESGINGTCDGPSASLSHSVVGPE